MLNALATTGCGSSNSSSDSNSESNSGDSDSVSDDTNTDDGSGGTDNAGSDAFFTYESPQTQPLALSEDLQTLYAVNTHEHRLSVFDISAPDQLYLKKEIPVGIEPVSVAIRGNTEAWVVNMISDSVSIVDTNSFEIIDTLYVPDEPASILISESLKHAYLTA